jgi:hypothetical protein
MSAGLLTVLTVFFGLLGLVLNLLYAQSGIFEGDRIREGVYGNDIHHFVVSKCVAWAFLGAAAMGLAELLWRAGLIHM